MTSSVHGNVRLGVSLSVRACEQYGIDPLDVMTWATQTLGLRRFRIMSYWDRHETQQGSFDFSSLLQQLDLAQELQAEVSLCLGLRQPRWPETHRPEWAAELEGDQLKAAVLNYIKATLEATAEYGCVTSYQLENEAFNKGIGHNHDFSRQRMKAEMHLIKKLSDKQIIMSLSNSWGLPVFGPIPDAFAVSIYPYQWTDKGRSDSKLKPWMIRLRASVIKLIWRRDVFCHELQMEPWGPKGTDLLPLDQQRQLMNTDIMQSHLDFAKACHMDTIDMWGLEWWFHQTQIDKSFENKLLTILSGSGSALPVI